MDLLRRGKKFRNEKFKQMKSEDDRIISKLMVENHVSKMIRPVKAFLIFKDQTMRDKFLEIFKDDDSRFHRHSKSRSQCCLIFEDIHLDVRPAPEPSNIQWINQGTSQ